MKKILVVDDDAESRKLISAALLGMGVYEIIEANTGAMAIEAANTNKPDLMLIDIKLPGKFDGIETARIIATDPDTSNIRIIMLAAKRQELDTEICKKARADDYIIKPFKPMALLNKIQDLIS